MPEGDVEATVVCIREDRREAPSDGVVEIAFVAVHAQPPEFCYSRILGGGDG